MPSFRDFLIETDDRTKPNYTVILTFDEDDIEWEWHLESKYRKSEVQMFEDNLTSAMNDSFKRDDISVDFSTNCVVHIPIRNQSDAHKTNLQDWMFHVKKVWSENVDVKCDIEERFISIREELPTGLKLDYNDIQFYLPHSNITSLAGISKTINCETLSFYSADKITSHVIGILAIPDIQDIGLENAPSQNCEWAKIIQRALRNNMDISDCIEEFVDVGMKEYAKF